MTSHAAARPDNVYTRGMANFAASLKFEDIPKDVYHRVKLLILDSLGCGLYCNDLEWSRILRETLTDIDDSRKASVWGTKFKLSPVHSALCNGTQVQGFEIDDVKILVRADCSLGIRFVPCAGMCDMSFPTCEDRISARIDESGCVAFENWRK